MKKRMQWTVMLVVLLSMITGCTGTQSTPAQTQAVPTAQVTVTEKAADQAATEVPPTEEPTKSEETTTPTAGETRTVVDSRGVEVTIPVNPQRVATVSDALVEEVMTIFGIQHEVVGIGSTCLVRDFTYDYETAKGEKFSYSGGMNPANYLNPDLINLPMFVKPGTEMNFESLAGLKPDVLIVDLGACTLDWASDPELMKQGLARLDSMGIPTIVLKGPNSGGTLDVSALTSEVRILGEVFNQQEKANKIATYLEESIQLVIDRTKDIPDKDKPSVLLLGLNPDVRKDGGVGNAVGKKDIQSYFVEEVVHAKNAFDADKNSVINAEQILALDPDVIALPTANGYHPPRELLETDDFKNIQTLKAIKNKRVGALPWSPCNCDKRLEYPIDVYVIAKLAYPEKFSDINLSEWVLNFYKEVYGVDDDGAMGLLNAQWMDWTLND